MPYKPASVRRGPIRPRAVRWVVVVEQNRTRDNGDCYLEGHAAGGGPKFTTGLQPTRSAREPTEDVEMRAAVRFPTPSHQCHR